MQKIIAMGQREDSFLEVMEYFDLANEIEGK